MEAIKKDFKNLRIMDDRIAFQKAKGKNCATVRYMLKADAERMMQMLVARNAYDNVEFSWTWAPDIGHYFTVTVWWED